MLKRDNPFFSIIMPCYNAAKFLGEAIESICNQTFVDWELIIVDDGSTDDSAQVISSFNDSRIKFFTCSENSGGAYIPRKKAADKATGQYIVPIDADDIIENCFLEILHLKIKVNKADIVIPEMWRLKEERSFKILPKEFVKTDNLRIGKDLVKLTLRQWEIPMAGFAVRKEIYKKASEKIKPSDTLSIHADELLSRWILALSPVAVFAPVKYFYRINEDSITHNLPRIIESTFITNEGLISLTEEIFGVHSYEYHSAERRRLISLIDMLRLINKNRKNLSGPQIKKALESAKECRNKINLTRLRGWVSLPYLMIMTPGINISRRILKFVDIYLAKTPLRK